jgi:hypothetical protein
MTALSVKVRGDRIVLTMAPTSSTKEIRMRKPTWLTSLWY